LFLGLVGRVPLGLGAAGAAGSETVSCLGATGEVGGSSASAPAAPSTALKPSELRNSAPVPLKATRPLASWTCASAREREGQQEKKKKKKKKKKGRAARCGEVRWTYDMGCSRCGKCDVVRDEDGGAALEERALEAVLVLRAGRQERQQALPHGNDDDDEQSRGRTM